MIFGKTRGVNLQGSKEGTQRMNWLIGVFIFFLGCLFSFIVSGVLHMNWEDEDED